MIGILSGIASIAFTTLLEFIKEHVFESGKEILHIGSSLDSRLLLPLLPVLGALLLIPLSLKYPGEVNGYGFPKFLETVNLRNSKIPLRSVFLKMLAPSLTIGTGGSAGVEGPSAAIGGGLGYIFGRHLGLSGKSITVMIAAGAAGTIAASFNAPIAGVMFAIEIILLGNYELVSFGAVVISAGMATAVSRAYHGANPAFIVPDYDIAGVYETPFYLVLGFLLGVLAVLYIKFFYKVRDVFEKLPVNTQLKPLIGALLVGAIGIFFPHIMSDGYEVIAEALKGHYVFWVFIVLTALKIVATSITLGSGGAGGVFAPALFIGAMAGGAYGVIVKTLFPLYTSTPAAYATVGVGAFLAATTHAPLTGMFLLFEMTGNYKIMLPIMFASIAGVFTAKSLSPDSIDTAELSRRGINLRTNMETAILQSIFVNEIMKKDFQTINENDPIAVVSQMVIEGKGFYFPVVTADNELMGVISMQDIKSVMLDSYIKGIVKAGSLATEDAITLKTADNLKTALEYFSYEDVDEIPVVESKTPKKVVGMLKRGDVITAYNKAVLKRQVEDIDF